MIYQDVMVLITIVRTWELDQIVLFQHRLWQGRNPHIRCQYIAKEIELTSPLIQVYPLFPLFPVGSLCALRQICVAVVAVQQFRISLQVAGMNLGPGRQLRFP